MGKLVLVGLLGAAACGRFGFDAEPAATPDAPAAAPQIACGEQPRFVIGAASVAELAVVSTTTGFAVVTLDSANALRGWIYEWSGTSLVAGPQNVAISTGVTGAFGITGIGDELLVGAIRGAATTYYPLDAALAARGTEVGYAGRVLGAAPLATSGTASGVAAIRFEANSVAVNALDMAGGEGSPQTLTDASVMPSELVLVPAHTGYAALWVEGAASPNAARLALLDASLQVTAGPISITRPAGFDVIRPRVAWSATSNTYAVTWYEKVPDDDEVFAQIFDAQLLPVTEPVHIMLDAVRPQVVAEGDGFIVVYRKLIGMSQRLEAVALPQSGIPSARTLGTSGGQPAAFALIERAGQPVAVFAEKGGTGPDLWFDPMCP